MTRHSLTYFAVVLMLAVTLAASMAGDLRGPDALAKPLESIDRSIAGWNAFRTLSLTDNVVEKLSPTAYLGRAYRRDGRDLTLFVAYYAQQRGGEAMHSPQACLPGSGWEIRRRTRVWISVQGAPVEVNRFYIRKADQQQVVFYWYQSGRRVIASEYMGKLLLVRDALLEGRTSGAMVRITLPNLPGADETGSAFVANLIPQVQRCFGL